MTSQHCFLLNPGSVEEDFKALKAVSMTFLTGKAMGSLCSGKLMVKHGPAESLELNAVSMTFLLVR